MPSDTRPTGGRTGPWFWLRPALAVSVSAALFVVIAILRWSVDGVADAISVLYVLPVALLALSFGLRIGLGAGVIATGLLALWVETSDVTLTPLGWIARATPLLLLGVLVGNAADRIRDASRAERHTAEVALLQREAAEINDHVLQQMAASKWLLEAGRVDDGVDLLASTMDTAQELVGRMLGPDSVLPSTTRADAHPEPAASARPRG